jgi:hypothetical protein
MKILWKWQRSVYFNLWLRTSDNNKKIGFAISLVQERVDFKLCHQSCNCAIRVA